MVVVDDSLVRGTTSRKIVKMLRDAGAREVHLRISAPPTTNPCYYGIDTPTRRSWSRRRIRSTRSTDTSPSDSLGYLSHEGMMEAVAGAAAADGRGYCSACFTGNYPVALGDAVNLVSLRRARV